MRASVAVLGVFLAVGCGPLPEDEGAPLCLALFDAAEPLTAGDDDRLFHLHYRADFGPALLVSGLHASIEAQQIYRSNVWNLRYELTRDLDGDGRFGPGDVVTVSERGHDVFGPRETGTYRVSLYDGDTVTGCLLTRTEWQAR